MSSDASVLRNMTAAACAASLVLVCFCSAFAGSGALFAAAPGGTGIVRSAPERDAASAGDGTDNYARCGKCHSVCEDGRSHLGRQRIGNPRGAGLPSGAGGHINCVTCHDARRHAVRKAAGGHLRISNLRRELCLACHRLDGESGPGIEIIFPPERAVVQQERLALIGRAHQLPEADLTVRLNGSEFHLQAKEGEFFTWLTLQEGVNSIEIAQREHLLWRDEVFLGEGFTGVYDRSSSGHRTGSRAQCVECHLKRDEMRTGAAETPATLCFGCHGRNDQKRYVHGPLAVGDCLACHDPHGGYGNAHLRREQALLCGDCHAARDGFAMVNCNPTGKACVACHDPHQSDARYLLKGPQHTMRRTAAKTL